MSNNSITTIENKSQLIQYFIDGIKKNNNQRIGVEHEKFLFSKNNLKRIDYQQLKQVFEILREKGWEPEYEKDKIIGLKRNNQKITTEPGFQYELSGAPFKNIHSVCSENSTHFNELKEVFSSASITTSSIAYDPFNKLIDIPKSPKERYKIMTSEMPKGGKLSLDMMYKTAGIQINYDYTSEKDFEKKFKIVNSIVPISIALFANSSIVEKKNSNYLSYRSKVWQNTSRGGLPKLFFEELNFEKYAEFIMNFPILFIQDNENYISGKKYIFKDFMEGKINEIKNRLPTENDLTTHLSTIFTENRLKKYIELRSMDTCGWDCLCAGPAFYVGMLYGNLEEVYELVSKWDKNKIINAYLEAPQKGFNTQLMGKDLLYWASTLLGLSNKGLENRDIFNKHNKNETLFLNHLQKLIANKTTNANHMINKFSKNEDLSELYDK